MKFKTLLPLVAILALSSISAHADSGIPDQWKTALDAGVSTLQKAQLFQAGEVGYLKNGSSAIWSYGGSGESSIFEIGSVSKSFTGIMLAEEIVEGKVALTDTVEKHLPEFKGTFVGGISLQQLATHTSGLPRMPCGEPKVSYCYHPKDPLNPYVDYTWQDLNAYLLQYIPAHFDSSKPRPSYERSYSNIGFALLGVLISEKDGVSFESLLASRISAPLRLNDTSVALNTEQKARFVEGHDITAAGIPHWDFDVMAPTGGIHSTATDMMKYLAANFNPEALLSNPSTKNLGLAMDLSQKEGLGWDSLPGAAATWKNGQTYGFSTWIAFNRQKGIGYFVIANEADSPDTGALLGLPFGQSLPDVLGLNLTSGQLAKFVGDYHCPDPVGTMRVDWQGRFLKIGSSDQMATMRATSMTEFNLLDGAYPDGWNKVSFTLSTDDLVKGLVFHSKDDHGNQNPDVACSR